MLFRSRYCGWVGDCLVDLAGDDFLGPIGGASLLYHVNLPTCCREHVSRILRLLLWLLLLLRVEGQRCLRWVGDWRGRRRLESQLYTWLCHGCRLITLLSVLRDYTRKRPVDLTRLSAILQ